VSDTVISVEGLSKRYVIPRLGSRHEGLRHAIEQVVRHPVGWIGAKRGAWSTQTEELWALRDVSFEVQQGDAVGIIGRNGSGKSTLFKVLSRITEPTRGRVRIKGRVASLLEVGTGFHVELTGRENIFLSGAILGMRRAEIRRKFDEIVAFSEIEKFLDTPVKRYSSGMYVRLAFSVAAHLEPDILIVDEVLAVGDAAFQQKCLGKMGEVASSGRTVLFVSHSMEAVQKLCRRGILLEAGVVTTDGIAADVAEAYYQKVSSRQTRVESEEHGLAVKQVVLRDSEGRDSKRFRPGDDLVVEVQLEASRRIEQPYLIIAIHGSRGNCFTANMLLDGHSPIALEGEESVACRFMSLPLLPQQRYGVSVWIRAGQEKEPVLYCPDVQSFTVVGDLAAYGFRGDYRTFETQSTPVVVPYEWRLPNGEVTQMSLARPSGVPPPARS
jgi:lipopolysaccharide transport system ATP-binding protein